MPARNPMLRHPHYLKCLAPDPTPSGTPDPQPAPASPAPTPAPAPVPEPPKPTPTGAQDPDIQNILADLGKLSPEVKVEPAKAADPAPAPDPTPAPDPKAEDQVKKPVVKKGKAIEEVVKDQIDKALEASRRRQERDAIQKPADPAPDPAPAKPSDPAPANDTSGLTDVQKETLQVAEFAESSGEKFKGLKSKVRSFFDAERAYRDAALKEDPTRTFDAEDEEYQRWMRKNRPIDAETYFDLKADWRAEVRAEAKVSKLRQEMQETRDDSDMRVRAVEAKPKIHADISTAVGIVRDGLKADGGIFKDAIEELESSDDPTKVQGPFAKPIRDAVNMAGHLASVYSSIANRTVKIDVDGNKDHRMLADFIARQSENILKLPDNQRIQDGRDFLPRSKMAAALRTDQSAREKYWTLEDEDVIGLLATNALAVARSSVKDIAKSLEAGGFTRTPAAPSSKDGKPPAVAPPTPSQSPAAVLSPGPGAAAPGKISPVSAMSDSELSSLLPGVPLPIKK